MGRRKQSKHDAKDASPTAASEQPPPETVRLGGTVRARGDEDARFGWCELSAGGEPAYRVERAGSFELVLDDGQVVEIDAARALVHALKPRSLRGFWDDVAADPLAHLARERAPGPHERVELRGVTIAPGDRVAVFGAITRMDAVPDTGGMRSAPELLVGAVAAQIVATGPDAARALEEAWAKLHAPPTATSPARASAWQRWGVPFFAVLTIAPWIAFAVVPRSPALALDMTATSAFFAAHVALCLWASASWPAFHRHGDPLGHGTTSANADEVVMFLGVSVFSWLVPLFAATNLFPSAPGQPEKNAGQLVAISNAIYLLFAAAWTWLRTRRAARDVGILLDAPPLDADPADGAWGSVKGAVRDPTPIASFVQPTTLAHLTETTIEEGSGPHPLERRLIGENSFLVDTGARLVEIHPKRATWATTVRETTDPTGKEREDGKKGERKSFVVDRIPVGGRILIAGRVKRQEQGGALGIAATGPGSLVMFATGPAEEPRTVLERALGDRRRVLIALVALALIPLLFWALVHGELPPVYLGPADD